MGSSVFRELIMPNHIKCYSIVLIKIGVKYVKIFNFWMFFFMGHPLCKVYNAAEGRGQRVSAEKRKKVMGEADGGGV